MTHTYRNALLLSALTLAFGTAANAAEMSHEDHLKMSQPQKSPAKSVTGKAADKTKKPATKMAPMDMSMGNMGKDMDHSDASDMGGGCMKKSGDGGMGMMGGMKHSKGGSGMSHDNMAEIMALDLSDTQRGKIQKIHDELAKKKWDLNGKIMEETFKLRDLYAEPKRDPAAIGGIYKNIFDFKRQIIEATLESHNRVGDTLTKEQQDLLQYHRRLHAQAKGGMGAMQH